MSSTLTNFKRNKTVRVLVSDVSPYTVTDLKGDVAGTTLNNGLGIYMKNVRFVTDPAGNPSIVGVYQGDLEGLRALVSDGKTLFFDKDLKVFTDGREVFKNARMVQVFDGMIKVVID